MPRIDEVYPSEWLRAIDLKGQKHAVTIDEVTTGKVGTGSDQKTQLIVTFAELDKPLGLNKTNAGRIGDVYGPDTDDWYGQRVVLFPTKVDYQGNEVDAIRVDKAETMNLLRAALVATKKAQARPAPAAPTPVAGVVGKKPTGRASQPMTQEEADLNEAAPFYEQAAPPPARPRPPRATAPVTQEEIDADEDIPF